MPFRGDLGVTAESPQLLEALNHPLRRRILRTVACRREPSSAHWLSQALDVPLGRIRYHVAFLVRSGALDEDGTEHTRGAARRLYRLTPAGRTAWVLGFLESDHDDGR